MTLAVAGSAVCGFAPPASATNWYLDGLNGGRNNHGTAASPYLYLWQALQVVQPGDTIYVVPSMTYPFLGFVANGTPGKPITLAGSDPSHLTYVSGGGINSAIWINGNYLTVKGFNATSPGLYVAINIADNHHHVTIASNVVHDAGQNGINVRDADYVTISHNVVYGNAKVTSGGHGSGISILASIDVDSFTGTKMIVDGNIVYENTNIPNCSTPSCFASASDSDGSGIILDDNRREQYDNVHYRGSFLISNNVAYYNGGRGVHIYHTDNVTVTGNTLYKNNRDPYEGAWHPGEVFVSRGGNIAVYNNILYSDGLASPRHTGNAPNTHVAVGFENCVDGAGPLIARYNLGYNPQGDASLFYYGQGNTNPVDVANNTFAGAQLENPAAADFRPLPGSRVLGAANAATSPTLDILGASRGSKPSIGAYQNPGP